MTSAICKVKRHTALLLVLALMLTMSGIGAYAEDPPHKVTDGGVTIESDDLNFGGESLSVEMKTAEEGLHDFVSDPMVFPSTSLMDGNKGLSVVATLKGADGNPIEHEGTVKVRIKLPEDWQPDNGLNGVIVNKRTAPNGEYYWVPETINAVTLENGEAVFTLETGSPDDEKPTTKEMHVYVSQRFTPVDPRSLADGVYDVQLAMLKDVPSYAISMASNTIDFRNAQLVKQDGRIYLRAHFNKGIVMMMPAFANKVYSCIPTDGEFTPTVESCKPGTIVSFHDDDEAIQFAVDLMKQAVNKFHLELDPEQAVKDMILRNGIRYINCFVIDITDSIQEDKSALIGFASDIMDSAFADPEEGLPYEYVMGADNGFNTTNIAIGNPVPSSASAYSVLPHKADLDMSRLEPLFAKYLANTAARSYDNRFLYTDESYGKNFVPAWQKVYQAMSYEKATQQDIDKAVSVGEEAWSKLVPVTCGQTPPRYKMDYQLMNLVKSMKSLLKDESPYTTASVQVLKDTVALAEGQLEKGDDALQIDLLTSINALNDAKKALKLKATDFTALEAAINDAKQVDIEHGKFTKASLDAFKAQLQAAQTMLDNKDASEEEIEAQIKALMAAKNGLADISDYKNLPKGKYEINVSMKKPDRVSTSMADGAIKHTAVLDVTDEGYFLTLDFNGIRIGANFGYLSNLWYYDEGYSYLPNGNPKGSIVPAEVLSTQKNKDGTDVIDQYNDKDHLYPDLTRIKIVNTALADESGFVPLKVMVKIMEAITPGTGEQNVLLKLDWANLKEYKEPENPGGDPGDVIPPAVDITDSATGIRVQAAAGVLPEGVKLVVREITGGAEYQRAGTALESIGKKFKLYDVCVTDKDGNEIQPADILTVSYPVPKGYAAEALQLYRIGEDGSRTLIKGMVMDGYYVVQQKHFSNYALVEKGSRITDAENKKNMGGKPNTGDSPELVRYVVLFAAAALIAGYAYRRRKGGKAE